MSFSVIIPDRNDRPEFTAHCFYQLEMQTLKPDQVIHVNYPPRVRTFDLSERVQHGLKQATTDFVFIFENDDYYPDNYFEVMAPLAEGGDIIGIDRTTYYNIRSLSYRVLEHFTPPRASFAFTGFRPSAFRSFVWPDNKNPLVDMALWSYAVNHNKRIGITTAVYPVSIKHGVGLCGVKWHYQDFQQGIKDPGMEWLKEHTRGESFDFYKQWHTRNR